MRSRRRCSPLRSIVPLRGIASGLLVAALAVNLSASTPPTAAATRPAPDWRQITPNLSIELPRDHGSHPHYLIEWWYLTGRLTGAGGREFGYQFTIFRRGIRPGPDTEPGLRADQVLVGHFATAAIDAGRFHQAQRVRRIGGGLAGAATDDLHVWLENWRIHRAPDDTLRLHARAPEHDMAVDFTLAPLKPLVGHGRDGYSRKGPEPGNASAYLSWTRLATRGTLELGQRTHTVEGLSWFDHEWGTTQIGAGVRGWDWFGLHLDDGRDLMIFILRREDGTIDRHSAGTLIDADGRPRTIHHPGFSIEARARWRSPHTGAEYPSRWSIRVPGLGLDLDVRTRIDDAEMRTGETVGTVYWEGPVAVGGSHGGRGYGELTGYVDSMAGRFKAAD